MTKPNLPKPSYVRVTGDCVVDHITDYYTAAQVKQYAHDCIAELARPAGLEESSVAPTLTMKSAEHEDGRVMFYIDAPTFYCEVEPDENGKYSVFIRDSKGREGFAEQAEPVAPPDSQPVAWLPMETAPKDGRILRLLVEFTDHAMEDEESPQATIGSNTFDDHGDFDEWQFAGWSWTQDCYTQGIGKPIGWLPMLDTQTDIAPKA